MEALLRRVRELDPKAAADALHDCSDAEVAGLLAQLNPGQAVEILEEFAPTRRERIAAADSAGEQWLEDVAWPESSVGRLMEKPNAVFTPGTRIHEAVEILREAVKQSLITYLYVLDKEDRLVGVVAFRELLFANPNDTLAEVMLASPFSLRGDMDLIDAMHSVVTRHYPVYPVCDGEGRLIGVVRGSVLFEQQAFEISAQAGAMVGVEKEERAATPWLSSLKFRHPWLQLNLFTAFIAWTFQPSNTALAGEELTSFQYLRMLAVARVVLDNFPSVQASWVTQGPKIGQVSLRFGANDFGSLMIEENVVSAAGAHFRLSEAQIARAIQDAGFVPKRRTMDYQIVGDPYCWSHETPSLPGGHAEATSIAS